MLSHPCKQCPWRTENHGKPHPFGFYKKANVTRLWNQLRRGGNSMSCHPTDPSHPDHVASGTPTDAKTRECAGAVILIRRELSSIAGPARELTTEGLGAYLKHRKKGLTKDGFRYWAIQRIHFGKVPLIGGPPLPEVNEDDAAISLPAHLAEQLPAEKGAA